MQGLNSPAPSDTIQYQEGVIIMLTAKLHSYSPEEVDLLKEVLEPAMEAISKHSNTNCCIKGNCESCKVKHVCYDISRMYDYLTLEAKYGYQHCKK